MDDLKRKHILNNSNTFSTLDKNCTDYLKSKHIFDHLVMNQTLNLKTINLNFLDNEQLTFFRVRNEESKGLILIESNFGVISLGALLNIHRKY